MSSVVVVIVATWVAAIVLSLSYLNSLDPRTDPAGYRFRRSWVGRRLNLGLAYAHQGGRVVLAAISPRYRRYRYRMVEEALANLAVLLGEGYALRDVIEKYSNDDDEGKVAP